MSRKVSNAHKVSPLYWLPFFVLILALGVFITVVSLDTLTEEGSDSATPAEGAYQKVIAIGDIACSPDDPKFNNGQGSGDYCRQAKIAEMIQTEDPDAILILGDIQYEQGLQSAFEKSFIKAWPDKTTPFITTPGNHEYASGKLDGYNVFKTYYSNTRAFGFEGETYFATNQGDWRIISLDSNCEYVNGCDKDSPQGLWLKNELDSNDTFCSLAISHHPVFTSGLHRLPSQTGRVKDFWRQLDGAGADILLVGHDHNYQRYAKQSNSGQKSDDGLRQFVVGTGGKNLYGTFPPYVSGHEKSITELGYLKLLLYENSYKWSFVNLEGEVLDKGRDSCR